MSLVDVLSPSTITIEDAFGGVVVTYEDASQNYIPFAHPVVILREGQEIEIISKDFSG